MSKVCLAIVVASALCGCSSKELYAAGQGWQRQECNKIIDNQERSRCMAGATRSYDEYKREADGSKSK